VAPVALKRRGRFPHGDAIAQAIGKKLPEKTVYLNLFVSLPHGIVGIGVDSLEAAGALILHHLGATCIVVYAYREAGIQAPGGFRALNEADQRRIGVALQHLDAHLRWAARDGHTQEPVAPIAQRRKQPHETQIVGIAHRHVLRQIDAVMGAHAFHAILQLHPYSNIYRRLHDIQSVRLRV